jgi:hypothetical protein
MILLGAEEDARATIFYIIKYITKDCTELASSLSVIQYAFDKQKLYPSKAINDNEDLKNGKYLLSIMLNKLVGMKEISDTQAAAFCIGFESQASTAKTSYIFIQSAIAAVKQRTIEDRNNTNNNDNQLNINDAWDDDLLLDEINNEDCDENNTNKHTTSIFSDYANFKDSNFDVLNKSSNDTQHKINWGYAPIKRTLDKSDNEINAIVPQHINYEYRGKALKYVRFFEYFCIIEVVTKKSIQINKEYKTKISNTTFPFQKIHPLEKTHIQRIKSLLTIPKIAGPPPPSMKELTSNSKDSCFSTLSTKQQQKMHRYALYYNTYFFYWTLHNDKVVV